jgi:flagellar assembly protein FliH
VPVVKNHSARSMLKKAVVLDLSDIRAKAEAIVAAAKEKAASITRDANAAAGEISKGAATAGRKEGFAEGQQAGHEEGLDAGRKEGFAAAEKAHAADLAALNTAWAEALEAWKADRTAQREDGRRDLLRLALGISERIVGTVGEHDPEVAQRQVETSMALLLDRTNLTVRVNPADMPLLGKVFPAMLTAFDGAADARLEADETVARGGCTVTSPDGDIDARLETQLSNVACVLFPELSQPEAST